MLILAAILAIFVYGMIAAMLGTILPDLSNRFKLTPKQNGTIAFAQAVGLMIGSFAAGPLIDNAGRKPGLLIGLALIAVALFLLPKSSGYGVIVGYLFMLGLGGGVIVTGANAFALDLAEKNGASLLNLVNLFFGLGGLATPFISANLLNRSSIRLCYLTAFLTIVTLAVYVAAPIPGPSGAGFQLSEAGKAIGSPALWLLSFMLFLYVSCEVGVWNWLPRYLIGQGIPEGRALNILSLGFALGLLVGRLAISPVLRSVAPETVTLGAGICMAITTYLALQTKNANVAWIAVFCAGLAMAPVFPTTLAIVGAKFSTVAATAIGIAATFGWFGLAVSSRIIGSVAGGEASRLKKALLVLPAFSIGLVIVNLLLRAVL